MKFWLAILLLHGSHRSYPSRRRACFLSCFEFISLLPSFLCVDIMLKMWKYLVTEHPIHHTHGICIFTKHAPTHRIKIVWNIQISLKNSHIIIWQIISREIWRTLKFKHKGGKNNYIQWNWMIWETTRLQLNPPAPSLKSALKQAFRTNFEEKFLSENSLSLKKL